MLSTHSKLNSPVIVLLLLSLGISSVVPQGLMIARVGQGPMDLAIVLCDGSKGLGSVPAFQKKPMPSGIQSHLSGHSDPHQGHATIHQGAVHHGESGGCADCDLTWASGLLEDVVHASGEIHFEFQSQQLLLTYTDYAYYVQQFNSYDSRAPPILLITSPIS